MAGPEDAGEHEDRESRYRRAAMLHPVRQRIARLLADGAELRVAEVADALGQPRGRIAYHLRLLVKRGVLKVVPRRRPAPPRYRWSSEAEWAREMLVDEEGDEQ